MTQAKTSSTLSINVPKTVEPPIDLVFLSRQTGDNESLARQLLTLFCQQSTVYIERLKQSETAQDWHRHCHGFKGSSREIGAFSLASLVESVERKTDDELAQKGTFIQRIEANLVIINRFIASLSRG